MSFFVRYAGSLGLIAVTVLTTVIVLLLNFEAQRTEETRQWIEHTHQVKEHVDAYYQTVTQLSRSRSSYLLTGDKSYLDSYHVALDGAPATPQNPDGLLSVDDQLHLLRDLTSDNPVQGLNLDKLDVLNSDLKAKISDSLTRFSATIPIKPEDYSALIAQTRPISERIISTVNEMRKEEDSLLKRRNAIDSVESHHSKYSLFAVLGLFYFGMVVIVVLLTRQRKLLGEKKRLITLTEESNDFIGSASIDGDLEYYNRGARKMLGLPDAVGTPPLKMSEIHPSWAWDMLEKTALPTVLEKGVWIGESAVKARDGTEVPVLQTLTLHRGAAGTRPFLTTIMRDITEYRQMRQETLDALSDERQQLTSIVKTQLEIVDSHHDLRFIMDLIIERTCALTGATSGMIGMLEGDEIVLHSTAGTMSSQAKVRLKVSASLSGIALRDNTILRSDDCENDERVDREAARKLNVASLVVVPFLRQKHPIGVLTIFSPVRNSFNDKHVATLSLMANFLSVALGDALAAEALANQAALLDLAHDAIIVRGKNDQVTFWSRGAVATYGWAKDDVVGTVTHDKLQTVFPQPLEEIMEELAKTGKWEGELTHTRKDGKQIVVASRWAVQHDKNGEPIGTLEINRDVTDRQMLMQKIVDSNTELERFAYVASHDMQEPLRMISGMSDIVIHDYADRLDEDGKNCLNIIRDSSERMRAMVHDLLDYARVDKGNSGRTEVEGAQEYKRALENLTELIKEKGAQVTADNLPSFMGNPIQIMRLLQNLITNAIKYQPAGQAPIIHVGAEKQGDYLCMWVKDNGLGIAKGSIDKVFEPFRRLHSWSDIKGTGLGLAVSKKIVENHGGKIWVTSTPGDGSTFWFTIALSE